MKCYGVSCNGEIIEDEISYSKKHIEDYIKSKLVKRADVIHLVKEHADSLINIISFNVDYEKMKFEYITINSKGERINETVTYKIIEFSSNE